MCRDGTGRRAPVRKLGEPEVHGQPRRYGLGLVLLKCHAHEARRSLTGREQPFITLQSYGIEIPAVVSDRTIGAETETDYHILAAVSAQIDSRHYPAAGGVRESGLTIQTGDSIIGITLIRSYQTPGGTAVGGYMQVAAIKTIFEIIPLIEREDVVGAIQVILKSVQPIIGIIGIWPG